MERQTDSVEETLQIGREMGATLAPNSIICLFGELGAGKTSFVKGIAEGAAGISSDSVQSPTFTYLNIYPGKLPIYHFDLYRIKGVEDFLGMGFDEYLEAGGVCCIEWSERIQEILPEACTKITLSHLSNGGRRILWT